MSEQRPQVIVCSPVFDDWESALQLLGQLGAALGRAGTCADVVFVDDGSPRSLPEDVPVSSVGLGRVEVLRLRRNLGHQRAIAVGLAFIAEERPCEAVVVMDADGEDAPEDMLRLLARHEELAGTHLVFARRGRRTETLGFRLGYLVYRLLHRALVGRRIEVGNFSVIPARYLDSLSAISELWNHYAAAVVQARLPVDMVTLDRSRRLAGQSRMNLVSLVVHGLSAISVYSDTVGVRLMIASTALGAGALVGMATVGAIRLFTDLALPGWATSAFGLMFLGFLQALTLAAFFVFVTLRERSSLSFLPRRDYRFFVSGVREIPRRA